MHALIGNLIGTMGADANHTLNSPSAARISGRGRVISAATISGSFVVNRAAPRSADMVGDDDISG